MLQCKYLEVALPVILYFISLSFCVWIGAKGIHSSFRIFYTIDKIPYLKTYFNFCNIMFVWCGRRRLFLFLWMHFSKEIFKWNPFFLVSEIRLISCRASCYLFNEAQFATFNSCVNHFIIFILTVIYL